MGAYRTNLCSIDRARVALQNKAQKGGGSSRVKVVKNGLRNFLGDFGDMMGSIVCGGEMVGT